PKFQPLIDQASAGIANFGAKVLAWAQSKQASDDITGFLNWFSTNGPGAWTLIKNIGDALKALSPGLTSGGALEMQILSDFFGFIAKLPPSFAKPITEVVGALLLASKLGVLSLGVKIVGASSKLLGLLTGTAKTSTIDIASAGMTSAADTMLLASQNMLKAAGLEDTAGAGGGAGVKAGEGAAGGAAGLAGGLLSVAALAAVALVVLDQIKVPGGGSVLRPKQSDLGVGGTWWNDAGSALGDKPQTGKAPGGAVAGGPSQLAPLASASQQGEPDFTKWWQDFDRDVVQKVAAWVDTTVPQTFTRAIPGWFANIWGDFTRAVVSPVASWITVSLPAAFTRSIPGWFTAVWQDFNRDVVQKIANWVTQSLPHFFTDTVPHWFDLAVGAFTGKVITPARTFITATIPGFFTATIPHWFDIAVTWLTSKVINPVKTFVLTTLPGFFTSTIPHWFDIAVTWLTSKVITPVKTFVLTTLPGFFTSTIPHWFDIAVTWLTSKVITPARTFVLTTLPGFFTQTIPHWFDIAVTWLTSKVITPVKTFVLTTLPGFFTSTIPHWFDSVGTWFTSKVINPVTSFITSIPGRIASGFKSGINTVIGFVDKVLSAVHLPTIPKLAKGGMVPGGYSRTDNQLVWMRSGEGVLQPGAVAALGGPAFIDAANRTYGDVPVGSSPAGHFAAGGVPGLGVVGDVVHTVTGVAKSVLGDVTSLLKSGFRFAFDHLWSALVSPVLGTVGHAPAGNIAVAVANEIKQHFDDVLAAKDAAVKAAAVPGGLSKATGNLPANWKAIVTYLVGHGFTPAEAAGVAGNIFAESGGNPDIWEVGGGGGYGLIQWTPPPAGLVGSGLTGELAQIVREGTGMFGGSGTTNPAAAAYQYLVGRERPADPGATAGTREASANAVYKAAGYDSGGWLQPGATMVMNATGRPEPVLSGDQWDAISAVTGGGSIGDKLDRIANLLAAQPRATASGVGDALNGTARMASFRNRYPRNN
ncbi:MAG TPA: phage tail tip lysozyme, partial [Trebonia sp.]|nr:phage tail tip lysozyme [Trebonia sp.]